MAGRLLFSTVSSVLQKQLTQRGLSPQDVVAATYLVLAALALPGIWLIDLGTLSPDFWRNISLASALDVAGWLFLVLSLAQTDLSIFGPLNAYKVVISMLLAILFLGETPSLQGLSGVALILAGSFLLMPAHRQASPRWTALLRARGVQYRFLSILLFSVGTVFLKQSVQLATPLQTLLLWSLIGLPLVLICNLCLRSGFPHTRLASLQPHLRPCIAVGAAVFIMQYLTLVLLAHMLVAYALALFQLGMLLQVFVGYKLFREPDVLRRLLASAVMAAGSLVVLLA